MNNIRFLSGDEKAKKKRISYTQKTLRYLREQGLIIDKAECWNPYGGKFGIRKDLFAFIDLVALCPMEGIIGVQSTSGLQHSKHRRDILENELALEWLKCKGKIWIISWSKKLLHRGGKARRWIPRKEEITLENFRNN